MKRKYIEPKCKKKMIIDLQDFVIERTNARLVSVSLHFACRKFIQELQNIPLSEELQ